jgi:hypothetical protein
MSWTIADGLTPAQARMMIALEAGPKVYNDRALRTIKALENLGLVEVDWDSRPQVKGNGIELVGCNTVRLTEKGRSR